MNCDKNNLNPFESSVNPCDYRQQYAGGETLMDFVPMYFLYMKSIGFDGKPASCHTIERHETEIKHIQADPIASIPFIEISFKKLLEVHLRWQNDKKKDGNPYSAASLNTRVKVLNLLISLTYKLSDLRIQPPRMPGFSTGNRQRKGCALNASEVQKLLETMASQPRFKFYYPLVLIGMTTGARVGELTALRWDDFEMDHEDGPRFRFTHHQVDGIVRPGRKGGAASIWYPVTPVLQQALAAHKKYLEEKRPGDNIHNLLFPALGDPTKLKYRGYIQRFTINTMLKKACEAAGIRRIAGHDMRQTLNTELQRQQVNPEYTRAVLGHKTVQMTEYYTALDAKDRVELFNNIYSTYFTSEDEYIESMN